MKNLLCPLCSRFLAASEGNTRVKCRPCNRWWVFSVTKLDMPRVQSAELTPRVLVTR